MLTNSDENIIRELRELRTSASNPFESAMLSAHLHIWDALAKARREGAH